MRPRCSLKVIIQEGEGKRASNGSSPSFLRSQTPPYEHIIPHLRPFIPPPMPVLRNVRRSRRLSKQAPRDEDSYWEGLDLLYPSPEPETFSVATTLPTLPSPPISPDDVSSSPSTSFFVPRSSHSRKRKEGHIPRPPNAFMLYRSDFWAKQKVTTTVERDHRHISRIAGHCWNNLSDAERAPYKRRAEAEKVRHAREHPEYKYTPVFRKEKVVKRKVNRDGEDEEERCRRLASLLMRGVEGSDLETAVKTMKEEDCNLDFLPASSKRRASHSRPIRRSRSQKKRPSVKVELLRTDVQPLRIKIEPPRIRLAPPRVKVEHVDVKLEAPSTPEFTFPDETFTHAATPVPDTPPTPEMAHSDRSTPEESDFVPTEEIPDLCLDAPVTKESGIQCKLEYDSPMSMPEPPSLYGPDLLGLAAGPRLEAADFAGCFTRMYDPLVPVSPTDAYDYPMHFYATSPDSDGGEPQFRNPFSNSTSAYDHEGFAYKTEEIDTLFRPVSSVVDCSAYQSMTDEEVVEEYVNFNFNTY